MSHSDVDEEAPTDIFVRPDCQHVRPPTCAGRHGTMGCGTPTMWPDT